MAEQDPQDFSEMLNAIDNGWVRANGLRLVHATRDEVVAEMEIQHCHLQPYGLVHGGVHASIIESLASIGAALNTMPEGRSVVGLENHTSFLRAVRSGMLRATAKPLMRGRRSQVWEGSIYDGEGQLVATGRVRLLVLEPDAKVAGEQVAVKG